MSDQQTYHHVPGEARESAKNDDDSRCSVALQTFADAMKQFQAAIPHEERHAFGQFDGWKSMLQDLDEQISRGPEKSRLLRCCRKVAKFAEHWEPFFRVTDIFVSSNPEWAAIAWGAVRFVFKLTGHYAVFFEKLADMFEDISDQLPTFSRDIELVWKRRTQRPHVKRSSTVVQILAHIFKEVLQFCQEACRIFCAKDKGIRYKINVIRDIFWKPFDVRFGDLLRRLAQLNQMYQRELELADREELMGHYEVFDNFIAQYNKECRLKESQSCRDKLLALRKQLRHIKSWISPPEFMATFDRENVAGSPLSGSWLLNEPSYQSWRKSSFDNTLRGSDTDIGSRTLFIYGSPGYGKTVLSVKVIEDLSSEDQEADESGPLTVAFFHFNKLDPSMQQPSQALRALLCQVIHEHQDDQDLVDSASILMDVEGSGQPIASEAEVAVLLKLFLQRYPRTAFVLDGIDECSVPQVFLDKLQAICGSRNCKLVLLTRPSVVIPPPWRHGCQEIQLSLGANTEDIVAFVRPRMNLLADRGLLPALDIDWAVEQVSQRANSLFLWAKLMMDFLECPALSPAERLTAITRLNLLDGLNPLYSEILRMIQSKFRQEAQTAHRAFQWIAMAHRPLTISELRTALALRMGTQVSSEMDYIADFQRSLIQICGALVEVHKDLTVHFIHLSAREFLTEVQPELPQRATETCRIEAAATHMLIAAHCLSYIIHDVPHQPLSGSATIIANIPTVEKRLPLLKYASDWPTHVIRGITGGSSAASPEFRIWAVSLAKIGEQFLQIKPAIAVWLESLWAFGITPVIQELSTTLSPDETSAESNERGLEDPQNGTKIKQTEAFQKRIGDLAADFGYLQKEWDHLLKAEPCQIWGVSINLFHSSEFLMGTTDAGLVKDWSTSTDPEDKNDKPTAFSYADETVLLTQVSCCGQRIGSVSIIPSNKYRQRESAVYRNPSQCPENPNHSGNNSGHASDTTQFHHGHFLHTGPMWTSPRPPRRALPSDDGRDESETAMKLSLGWKARIQVRPMEVKAATASAQPQTDLLVDLPQDQIFPVLMASFYDYMEGQRLALSVAFSPDLATVSLLRCIIHLTPAGDYVMQCFHEHNHTNRTTPVMLQITGSHLTPDLSGQLWHEPSFSKDGRYLAVIRSGPLPPADGYGEGTCDEYYECSVAVFENMDQSSMSRDSVSKYEKIADSGALGVIGAVTKVFTFHPSEPYLVIASSGHVYLWNFDQPGETPKMLFDHGMNNVSFSLTGDILSGDVWKSDAPVWHPVEFGSRGHASNSQSGGTGEEKQSEDRDVDEYWLEPFSNITPGPELFTSIKTMAAPMLARPIGKDGTTGQRSMTQLNGLDVLNGTGMLIRANDHTSGPAVQFSGDNLTVSSSSGVQRIHLKEDKTVGTITLEAIAADGTTAVADLLRVPRSIIGERTSISFISTSQDSPVVRLVVNKAATSSCELGTKAQVRFPILIERKKDSIPVVSGTKRLIDWDKGGVDSDEMRERRKRL